MLMSEWIRLAMSGRQDLDSAIYCIIAKAKAKDPSRATRAHRAALITVSIALSQTPQPKLQVHGYGASVSRGVPV